MVGSSRIHPRTYDIVNRLVARASEIEIMCYSMLSASIDSGEDDLHVEFAPSFLLEMEWRFFERWSRF